MWRDAPPALLAAPSSGYLSRLNVDEQLVCADKIDPATVRSKMPFVGAIEGEEVSAMGCLLKDGKFLTTLHSIYDLDASHYYDLQSMSVFFVKGRDLYRYQIKRICHDGAEVRRLRGATPFDYALLELHGDPARDLGGGLDLDQTNHLGSAFASDPGKTLAISAPVFGYDVAGRILSVHRYVSTSHNSAVRSGPALLQQMGSHFAVSGMSGQAIFPHKPAENKTLYAVHVGYDHAAGERFGFRVSDYLYMVGAASRLCPPRMHSTFSPLTVMWDLPVVAPFSLDPGRSPWSGVPEIASVFSSFIGASSSKRAQFFSSEGAPPPPFTSSMAAFSTGISGLSQTFPTFYPSGVMEGSLDAAPFFPASTETPFFGSISREANERRKARMRKEEEERARRGAIERTDRRLAAHPVEEYEIKSARELAAYFPKLGARIFARPEQTPSNKTLFINPDTGWYVCQDNHGKYNTVFNERGWYVALDGTESALGQDSKFHFLNTPPREALGFGCR